MKLVFLALFWRPSLQRPWRLLITIIGVATGVGSVLATVAASRAAVASMREGAREVAGRSTLEITRPGGVDEKLLGELRAVCRYATLLPVVEEPVQIPALHEVVRLLGVDLLVDVRAREFLRMPSSGSVIGSVLLDERSVVLPEALARELDVEIGDVVRVLVHSREVELRVAATFDPHAMSSALDRLLVVDVALAQELVGRQGFLDRIELVAREGVDAEQLRIQVSGVLPAPNVIGAAEDRARQTASMLRALDFNLTALSGVSLFVGAVLVATTLATSVVRRRASLSLLVSLGASRATIGAAIAAEALAIGVLGGLLGVVLGHVGALLCVNSVRATVSSVVRGIPHSRVVFDLDHAAFGVLLGVVVALCACVLPLREALRSPPIEALRGASPSFLSARRWRACLAFFAGWCVLAEILARLPAWNGLPVAGLLSAFALLSALASIVAPLVDLLGRAGSRMLALRRIPVVRIAIGALAAGRERAAWAAGALAMAAALAVSMTTMIESFRVSVSDWTRQTMRADLFVKSASRAPSGPVGTLDPEVVSTLQRMFGVAAVDPFYSADAFRGAERVELGGSAFNVAALHDGGVPFRDGRPSKDVFARARDRHEVVINESLARKWKLHEGDVLRLRVADGERDWRIEGVFFDYSSSHGLAVIDRDDFLAIYPDHGPWNIDVHLDRGVDPETSRKRFLHELRTDQAVTVLLTEELRTQISRVFDRTFAITHALQMVAAVVAVIAVLTVLGALVREREADLAVLTALGGSRAQLFQVVLVQGMLMASLGAAAGVVAGLRMGRVLVEVVNVQSFGWTLRMLYPWSQVGLLVSAVVIAGLLAAAIPAARALRVEVGDALRQET